MNIIDNIMLYNEIDLIKCRISEHYEFVDKIVIIESNETLARKPKPLFFQEHISEFKEWKDKIVYKIIDGNKFFTWEGNKKRSYAEINERRQRYYLSRYEPDILNDYDYIFYFDADEHISKESFPLVLETLKLKPNVVSVTLKMFYYFLDVALSKGWSCNKIVKINSDNLVTINIPGFCGFHFSFLGGPNQVFEKVQNYSHCLEYKHLDLNSIIKNMKLLQDVLERKDFEDKHGKFLKLEGNTHLPKYIQDNWNLYYKYSYEYFIKK